MMPVFPNKYFRIDIATGNIVGVSRMNLDLALRNLPQGQTLRRWDAAVKPSRCRWDEATQAYVSRVVAREPATDPIFMRRTAYSETTGDQLGAVMKLLGKMIRGEDPTQAELEEFNAVESRIAEIKSSIPVLPSENED